MAQDTSPENIHVHLQKEDLYDRLDKILKEEEEQVKKKPALQAEQNKNKPDDKLVDKLLEALAKNDASEVWKLLENNHTTYHALAENSEEKNKDYKCKCNCTNPCSMWNTAKEKCNELCSKICEFCNKYICCKRDTPRRTVEIGEPINNEKYRKRIRLLSNPLFISVEWLWITKSRCEDCQGNRSKDVIEGSLHDAYLLDKLSSYEHHYSREEYMKSVEAYETFAAGVLEESTLPELYEIIDIEGNGCLLQKVPQQHRNFIQSLSLLKFAANKGRKKFVSSPGCQVILNEIIYYKIPGWQDKSKVRKLIWFLFQLVLVSVLTGFYIFYRPFKKMCKCSDCCKCCDCCKRFCDEVENLYEHPYNKFVNHTMSYIVLLCLLVASTFGFEHEYRTSTSGLLIIDYAVLAFVLGLFLQELWEAYQQGVKIYFSKWWNVVAVVTISTFVVAYMMWIIVWQRIYGEWQPRRDPFIVADVLYASATVLAFFHLTHVFQVNSTLGPLQLSLYRMLKDVVKFLIIFLMLFIAFGTGVVKVYSYYVASQMKLREQDNSHYQESHPYAEHQQTFIGLVWLLVGYVEEDKIVVDDPAFYLTTWFGRLGLVAYLVCTTIVALNMLIAMMNNSFNRVFKDEDMEWKFSRARMWLEWIDKGNAIPVPFNILYYVLYCIVWIFLNTCCRKCRRQNDDKCICSETGKEGVKRNDEHNKQRQKQRGRDNDGAQTDFEESGGGEQIQSAQHAASEEENEGNQTSTYCCKCFPYDYGKCRLEQGQSNAQEAAAHCCTCLCIGFACYCKPIPKPNTMREVRFQAMESSVARYLKKLSGEIEGQANVPKSLMDPQANDRNG